MHCNIILFWEGYLCSSNWSLAGLSLRFQVGLITVFIRLTALGAY